MSRHFLRHEKQLDASGCGLLLKIFPLRMHPLLLISWQNGTSRSSSSSSSSSWCRVRGINCKKDVLINIWLCFAYLFPGSLFLVISISAVASHFLVFPITLTRVHLTQHIFKKVIVGHNLSIIHPTQGHIGRSVALTGAIVPFLVQ